MKPKEWITTRLRPLFVQIGIVVLLLIGCEVACQIALSFKETARAKGDIEIKPAPRKVMGIERPRATIWAPYVGWGEPEEDTRGLRQTYLPTGLNENSPLLHIYGGSTVWAPGVDEEETIPSFLAKRLEREHGIRARVINFGAGGWVNTQSMVQYALHLRSGNIPDVAIFYDGCNEIFSAYSNLEAGVPLNAFIDEKNWRPGPHRTRQLFVQTLGIYRLAQFLRRRLTPIESDLAGVANSSLQEYEFMKSLPYKELLAQLPNGVVQKYVGNLKVLSALSKSFNVKSAYYWQPTAFSSGIISPTEKREPLWHVFNEEIMHLIQKENKKGAPYIDISSALRSHKEVFFDSCHIDSKGNQLIANEMINVVLRLIREVPKNLPQ